MLGELNPYTTSLLKWLHYCGKVSRFWVLSNISTFKNIENVFILYGKNKNKTIKKRWQLNQFLNGGHDFNL